MFTSESLLQFYDWAQHGYNVLFDHAATLSPEELHRELPGFGFPTVCLQLAHIAGAEQFWFSRLRGDDSPDLDEDALKSVAAIRAAYGPVQERTREFIGSLSPAELTAPRRIDFGDGSGIMPPAGVLCHVLTHGYHHKGQVVAMCRLLGHPAPETDLDGAL